MTPETFAAIVKEREAAGASEKSATKQAGKTYWNAEKAKYAKAKGKK